MAADYYSTLGVDRKATREEIQKAYRQMARKYHPDLNPNDPKAKAKFHEIQTAFDVLNDPEKREMFDRYGSAYESVASGGGPGPQPWSTAAGGAPGGGGQAFDINLEDLFGGGGPTGGGFADLFKSFGQRGKRQGRATTPPGQDIEYSLTVPFNTAVLGGEARVMLQRADGQRETIHVKVPAGIESGKKIRLRGQGDTGRQGGPPGDLLIKVDVAPHPLFRRTGNRLDVRVPITLAEAIGGAKIDLPTPHGTITLTVPPNTSSGSKLRVKGHGVKQANGTAGDLFAEVLVVLPKGISEEDRQSLLNIFSKYPENPRANLKW